MQKLPLPAKPTYVVGSVDRALKLLQMLRDHGHVRLRAAACELGVAESTVHRLLAMLVYRGFAVQDASHVYLPGPALGVGPTRITWTRELRDIAIPHMELLSGHTGESVNLVVRVGTKIHFLWGQEGSNIFRIVSREGAVLPARSTAAGKVLLADLTEERLRRLYQGTSAELHNEILPEPELQLLLRNLRLNRKNGYATGKEGTEMGVSAIAMPLRDRDGRVIAAFAVAVPVTRFDALVTPHMLQVLKATQQDTEEDLRESGVRSSAG
jgi:IclR family acetate operon transcriptional repressor